MKSNHTRQIINEIAEEEGMDERSIMHIVSSQFEGVNRIITSGVPDHAETFKSVRINAFGVFKFLPWRIKMMRGRKHYEDTKRRLYDSKK
jgi:nucleoid DNA-binding protein